MSVTRLQSWRSSARASRMSCKYKSIFPRSIDTLSAMFLWCLACHWLTPFVLIKPPNTNQWEGEIPDIDQLQRSITLSKVPELNVVRHWCCCCRCVSESKQAAAAVTWLSFIRKPVSSKLTESLPGNVSLVYQRVFLLLFSEILPLWR